MRNPPLRATIARVHWHWEYEASPPVSFCVRALVLDGLAVPPFDRHPAGDGRLRELGLDAATWREWVIAVLRQHAILGEHARGLATPDARGSSRVQAPSAFELLREPGSFCPGRPELQARLGELFAACAEAGEAWRWRMSDTRGLLGSGRQQRALWRALTPFHARLATLSVFLVEYVQPVVMTLAPTTCLIAPDPTPEGFGRQVVAAAATLAAAAKGSTDKRP